MLGLKETDIAWKHSLVDRLCEELSLASSLPTAPVSRHEGFRERDDAFLAQDVRGLADDGGLGGWMAEPRGLRAAVRTAVEATVPDGEVLMHDADPAIVAMLGTMSALVGQARAAVSEQTIGRMIEMLLASHDPAAATRAEIDADNAVARIAFMEAVPCLTSGQLADLVGHGAKNRSQTASRWKAERRSFSLPWRGREEYPAFQFRDGRPLPAVAAVLAALPNAMSAWQIAFWFVSSNRWLDGAAPRDRLGDTPALVRAAEHEAAALVE